MFVLYQVFINDSNVEIVVLDVVNFISNLLDFIVEDVVFMLMVLESVVSILLIFEQVC